MEKLNSFVTELLKADSVSAGEMVEFTNPRDGWVFLSVSAKDDVKADIGGETVAFRMVGDRHEAMCLLPGGNHTMSFADPVRDLVVRTMPELAFCKFQYDPHISEFGPYDWDFLSRHVLPHVNTIVGGVNEVRMAEWKARGGVWIHESVVPGFSADELSAEEAFEAWEADPGFVHPLMDGVMSDEFFSGDNPKYPVWTKAMRRIADDERFRGKMLRPYVGSHYPETDDWGERDEEDRSKSSAAFYRAVFELGYRISWERYLQERHDRQTAEEYIRSRLGDCMKLWRKFYPDCAHLMTVALGYMTITESLDIHPGVNYKYFMDMQFHHMATCEEFDGIGGVLEYTSGYADEETVRWAARLYRHYCIEGNTDLLSDRLGYTFENDHIHNPDFAHHWEGWSVPVSIERNCKVVTFDGYAHLQGRWPRTTAGDTGLVLRRDFRKPNVVSQKLRNLVPGRLYSAKMISGDYSDLKNGRSTKRIHGVAVQIEGGDVVPEKTFVSEIPNNYSHCLEPFTTEHPYWFNYHNVVFRAEAETGTLTITDWPDGDKPGGPSGQEIVVNFVEVEPYYGEEENGAV